MDEVNVKLPHGFKSHRSEGKRGRMKKRLQNVSALLALGPFRSFKQALLRFGGPVNEHFSCNYHKVNRQALSGHLNGLVTILSSRIRVCMKKRMKQKLGALRPFRKIRLFQD
jgi:hypothetical protein